MRILTTALLISALAVVTAQAQAARNVVVITVDGLRWQEVFGGADASYFKKSENNQPSLAEQQYVRPTPAARREVLLPFIWSEVAKRGQIFGDPDHKSRAHVTNGLWFSYPGYNEMFSGAADPRITSNDKIPNPNVTVLEWLNSRPGFEGKVRAFGAWDRLPYIVNSGRSRIPVGTGFAPVPSPKSDRERAINQLAEDLPPVWDYGTLDAPIVAAAIESLRADKPRVLYVMLGEGDEWAHQGRYDLYIDAAHRADRFMKRIWDTLQSLPEYRGTTAMLLTTDHGRGATVKDWTDHGTKVPAAEATWIAAIGPGISPAGVREGVTVTTSQLAATIAALVGENFMSVSPTAAPVLPGVSVVRK